MNFISRSLACFLLLATSSLYAQIPWVTSPEQALQMAQRTGKPILLHFYTDSCPPCKMLEYRAFRDTALIATMNASVIPVRVNAEDRRDIAQHYAVTRWPTDVYLMPDGSELYRTVSPQDPADYGDVLNRIATRCHDALLEVQVRSAAAAHRQANMQDLGPMARAQAPREPIEHPPIERKPIERTPPRRTPRETTTFASTAPNHMAVVSYPTEAEPPAAQQAISDPAPQAAKPKTNRYRTQSSNFGNQSAQQSASMPSHVVSPYVNQQHTQAAPAPARVAQPAAMPNSQQVPPQESMQSHPQRSLMASNNQLMLGPTAGAYADQPDEAFDEPSQTPEQTQTRQSSPNVDEVALDGHCPVILDQKRWEPGNLEWAVRHRGKIYYCSSRAARDAFLAEPDRYSPMLSGYDVVRFLENGQIVPGKREFGCWFGGRVYLFDSEETRRVFDLNVNRYLQQLNQLQATADQAQADESNAAYR